MGKMSELDQELREKREEERKEKEKKEKNWFGIHKPEAVGKSDSGEELTNENLSSDDYMELWKQKHGLDDDFDSQQLDAENEESSL